MALLLKNLLFTLLIPGAVAVAAPLWILQDPPPPPVWAVLLSIPLFALGAAIYTWCVWDFASFGRGTPAPIDAPKKLVVRGLYRYTRNPMYVGVLTVIAGWTLLHRSGDLAIYAALVAGGFHVAVVLYEEPHLRRLFGDEYDAYRARVGRWLPRPRA